MFSHLQNKDEEFLLDVSRKLQRTIRTPFAFILTCDRAEMLAEEPVSPEILERSLSLNPIQMKRFRYSLSGDDALMHIFLLATGIASPLFGEETIISQIKLSGDVGRLSGSLSPGLAKLLNAAAAFGKRVHTEMKIRVFDKTIIDEVCARLAGYSRILIVGSGECARLLSEALLEGHDVAMTLRDADKSFLVTPGVKAVPYDERRSYVPGSDAVVSATSGLYHTFDDSDRDLFSGKPLFDLSSPHDIPDSLSPIRTEDLSVETPERDKVIKTIVALAEDECSKYKAWFGRKDNASAIEERAEAVAYDVLRRLSAPLSRLDKANEKALRSAVFDSVRKAVISNEMGARKS